MKKLPNLPALIASFFILVFVYTAVSKLTDRQHFEWAMQRSPLIRGFRGFLSWAIPVAELGIAFLLFAPRYRKTGLLLAAAILLLFTAYITYMISTTPHLPCSCGGVIKQMSWKQHLVFNIICSLLAAAGYIMERRNKNTMAR